MAVRSNFPFIQPRTGFLGEVGECEIQALLSTGDIFPENVVAPQAGTRVLVHLDV